ncbi:AAA family ATPase [Demequina gelatinilytica]|uniref:AAA family ATPase n=1 Tax=Demequina gelatinilytica TaxID=1638980 RepID=UPI000784A29A|nr:SMC family ATPase [Demequina gelatinilytica]
MKAISLTLEGFGPYLARQEVDFTAFDTDRLFVITGKTGAGKSTILDAITFALYGDVPRYDGTKATARSHFCTPSDPTEVTLVFEVGTQRYRITRTPEYERPKSRGTGTTTEKPSAKLWRWAGGDWEAVAMAPREVGHEVGAIMQLTSDQFLQVILLAQGRFAEFLQSGTDSRLKLLRSLFGTQRFEDLTASIRDLARTRYRAIEAADAELEVIARNAATVAGVEAPGAGSREEWLASVDDALRAAASELGIASAAAGDAATAARETFAEARRIESERARLATARERVVALEEGADAHATDVARRDLARRAAPVAGALGVAARASAALAAAREARETALVGSEALAGSSLESLRGRVGELDAARGALDGALEAERSLAGLELAAGTAAARVEAAREARDAHQAGIDAVPAREQELRARRDELAATAVRLDDLDAAVTRAERSVAAHERLIALESALAEAREREATASGARRVAVDAHDALLQRRLRSQAAHLAATLVDGEPCAVCGATAHPSPAQPTDEHATDEEVDAAAERAAVATAAFERAQASATEAHTATQVARAEAGDGTREEAAAVLGAARTERDSAAQAAEAADALARQLAALEAEAAALKERLAEAAAALETAQTAATEAATALATARSTAERGRGEHASVAARAAEVEQERGRAEALATATETLGSAERAASEAQAALTSALAEAGFADAAEARDGALPGAELAALESRIVAYDAELAGARAVVAELATVALPAEVADLAALETASAEAERVAKDAARALAEAESRAAQFAALAVRYREKAAQTAEARERHAVVETLASTLEGSPPNERRMRLESFVLAARLEEIVAAANARLGVMSNGQYLLEYDDSAQFRNRQTGLELRIADAHTGRSRSTRSLSGGETFLASLALALGLAETVTAAAGGIQLDTIFIDEGFGSLDAETLEIAMSTLDDLRDAGRTIGLISHVETMKEQIPAKLEVVKAGDGSSRVSVSLGDG